MVKETMTVHEALREVKLLNVRISDKIAEFTPCFVSSKAEPKIGNKPKQEWIERQKAEFQSIKDLMKRRVAIKNALALSNATTKITINGEEYSIAAAIDMKNTKAGWEQALGKKIVMDITKANTFVEKQNELIKKQAADFALKMYSTGEKNGANTKDIPALAEKTREDYYNSHMVEVYDPIDCIATGKELIDTSEDFLSKLDSMISVSNAQTVITIEY